MCVCVSVWKGSVTVTKWMTSSNSRDNREKTTLVARVHHVCLSPKYVCVCVSVEVVPVVDIDLTLQQCRDREEERSRVVCGCPCPYQVTK